MGIDDWSTDESQNLELDGSDISRRASPGAPANELVRKLMAHVKELEGKIVSDGIEVDGVSIVNNDGTLTVVDVAIDGDTEDLLTEKIAEIEEAATQAGEDATAAQTAATQAASSASDAVSSVTSAATAANVAAEQADIAVRAAARAQSGAAMAESAVQAVMSGTNLNWQKTEKAASVSCYPVPETVLEPAVDFLFAETGPDSGTKAPDNPSTITGVSTVSVTRCETAGVDEKTYTVDLGGVYYGGNLNVSTGLMTVKWVNFFLKGTEPELVYFTSPGGIEGRIAYNMTAAGLPPAYGSAAGSVCSHASVFNPNNNGVWGEFYVRNNGYFMMQDKENVIGTSKDDYLAWFTEQYASGSPVTVAYLIATPFTVQISPAQIFALPQADKYVPRQNTIYTDAQSVQVGYAKSPIRSEYEFTQAIIATEGGE